MAKNVVKQYLDNYAEPEVASATLIPQNSSYHYSLVIPAYKESITFADSLLSGVASKASVLIVLVINQPGSETDSRQQQALYQHFLTVGSATTFANLTFISLPNSSSDILIVDRFTTPINDKQGVGLARKIGCDIVVSLQQQGIVKSSFIASTDADAQLPSNYFEQQTTLDEKTSAACYNFVHESGHEHENEQVHLATQLYEKALRYYVKELKKAGSPYAFYTIGSILLFNITAYAKVRGFPKKSAGEDFYLINKLAKVGQVTFFENSLVRLTARVSDRVPFGTGPAVKKIMEGMVNNEPYLYYHPKVFSALAVVLQTSPLLIHQPKAYQKWLATLPEYCANALLSIGFEKFIIGHEHTRAEQLSKQWQEWFDAFKTLKFIHYLRDNHFENIPLNLE